MELKLHNKPDVDKLVNTIRPERVCDYGTFINYCLNVSVNDDICNITKLYEKMNEATALVNINNS